MDTFFVVFFMLLMLGLPLALAYYTIAPVHRASRGRRAKLRIQLIDIIALLILIQVALAILVPYFRDRFTNRWYIIAAILVALIVVVWRAAVDALSQLEVRQASRRLWMQLIFLPGVCALMVATIFALAMVASLFSPLAQGRTQASSLAVLLICIGVGSWFLRTLGNWIIKGSASSDTQEHEPVSHQSDA